MQKVIVQIDWYTKIVLTLIAVLLAGLLAKPYVVSRPAGAYDGQEVYVTNWPNRAGEEIKADVWVKNWPDLMSVEVKKMPYMRGEVYVTDLPSATFTVVDWKEEEDYREYLKKQWEKKKGE